jgi:hypothetical protein
MAAGTESQRPQIAAMERGPGPARYQLPTMTGSEGHDATRRTWPTYSFGRRLGTWFGKSETPGPGYAIDPTITRKGKDGTPSYSLYGRHKDLNSFKTPGPGRYVNEKVFPQGEKHAPAYSMGSRSRYRKRDSVPAPSSYTLPTMIGRNVPNRSASATFIMTGRPKVGGFSDDYKKTPAPNTYAVLDPDSVQKKAPVYSMRSRSYMPGDSSKKPGPGAHSPEKVKIHMKSAPAPTMGVRHSEYICPLITDPSM